MPAQGLDRTSATPLWEQLQRELLTRLRAGEFAEQFPGELALAEQYEVSRQTVRQALRHLRAEGVIVAERGRHPRVAPISEIRQPMGALYSLFASVRAAGLRQRSVVLALDQRADGVVAQRLGLEASTPLVYLERLRMAGESPLAWDRAWLPAETAAPLLGADFAETSLYGELAERAGVRLDSGSEDIRAVMPTAAERARLDCGEAVAAFAVNRLGWSRGRAVEWRHTLVRGDRFALAAEFSAREGYRLAQGTS